LDENDFIAGRIRESQQIKTLCDHCGNISFKDLICEDSIVEQEGNTIFIKHQFYRCTICNDVILKKTTLQLPDDYQGSKQHPYLVPKGETVEEEQLWPASLSLPIEVPDRVRKIYEEARLVKRSPSSFVVQIGRALEAITKDKKAQGRTLNDRLNWLTNQEFLPPVLGQMGHINRILRNWGAHDAETEVELEDVEIVDEFFRAIVEYLYVAPAKVKKIQELVDSRQGTS
jgi:hypothetical protein